MYRFCFFFLVAAGGHAGSWKDQRAIAEIFNEGIPSAWYQNGLPGLSCVPRTPFPHNSRLDLTQKRSYRQTYVIWKVGERQSWPHGKVSVLRDDRVAPSHDAAANSLSLRPSCTRSQKHPGITRCKPRAEPFCSPSSVCLALYQ